MNYINQKLLKEFAGKNVEIKKIYPSYRKWFNSVTNQWETFKIVDGKWNEEKWVDKQRVLEQREPNFKLHKKVYDIVIGIEDEMDIDGKLGKEFTVTGVGANKIKDIAETTVAFGKVPQREDGTPEYDWEDKFVDQLPWKTIIFSTKNVKKVIWDKEVEYAEFTFRDVPSVKKVEEDDLPF